MCRFPNFLRLFDSQKVEGTLLARRKYQEIDGKPINLVRYEYKCQVSEKVETRRPEQAFTDNQPKVENAVKQSDERDQLWSESNMDMFQSFYSIPQQVGVTEYDLNNDCGFKNQNQEFMTGSFFDDD